MTPSQASRLLVLAATAASLLGTQAVAQTNYSVTLAPKSTSHPYYGQGEPEAFVINGIEANQLTLTRGQVYRFNLSDIPAMHPFYISTSNVGAGDEVWSSGVQGNFSTGSATVTFTVPDNAPDVLWYQCGAHIYMGGRLNIAGQTDSEPDPDSGLAFAVSAPAPHPAGDLTTLRLDLPSAAHVAVVVYDLLGRQVLKVDAGALPGGAGHELRLDIAPLGPGIYYYQVHAHTAIETLVATGSLVRVL